MIRLAESDGGNRRRRFFISSPGGNGIFLNHFNKGITIKNCLITECGESGIALVGKSMLTREKSYECPRCGMKHPWGFTDPTREYSSGCVIENNLIHHIGVWGKQTVMSWTRKWAAPSPPIASSGISRIKTAGSTGSK